MRLVEFGVLPTEDEIVMWNANCETIQQQIQMRNEKTIEELRNDEVFKEILMTIVERMPRESDIFRLSAIKSDENFERSRQNLLDELFKMINRLVGQQEFRNLFDKVVLIEFLTLFMRSKPEETKQLLKKLMEMNLLTQQDLENYLNRFNEILLEFTILCGENRKELDGAVDDRKSIHSEICADILVTIGSCVTDISEFSSFLAGFPIKIAFHWMEKIPELFEEIVRNFNYQTLFEMASNIEAFPLRKIFEIQNFAKNALIDVFVKNAKHCQHRIKDQIEKKMESTKLFVGHVQESGNENILKYFIPKIDRLIEESRILMENETIYRLKRCGYLEMIGRPADALILQEIYSIREILPNFSMEYIHLVLRHFSYQTDVALSNLLSNEHLPLELLRISNVDLKNVGSTGIVDLPPLDFTASDEIEKSTYENKKRKREEKGKKANASIGLFSLAIQNSESNIQNQIEEVDEESEVRKKANEYKEKVMSQLSSMRSSKTMTTSTSKIDVDNENLVPMATSKKYSALNSLKITDAEKVAIRPVYDKYRYETPNDDGMYDDEYDDEDERREFNVERLNEELETSSDEEEDVKKESEEATSSGPSGGSLPKSSRGRGRGRGNSEPDSGRGRGRGINRGRGGGGGSGSGLGEAGSSDKKYTGGRDRQLKERHKGDHKQRGADRKMRGAF